MVRSKEDSELYDEIIDSLVIQVITYSQVIDFMTHINSTNNKPTKLIKKVISITSLSSGTTHVERISLRRNEYKFYDSIVDIMDS